MRHRQLMHEEQEEEEREERGEEEATREEKKRPDPRREQADWRACQLRKEAKRRAMEERKRRWSIMPNYEDAEEVEGEEDEGREGRRSSSSSIAPWARGHHRAPASTSSSTSTATATAGSLLGVLVRVVALCLLIVVLLLLGRWGSAWTKGRALEWGGEEASSSAFSTGSPLIPRLEGLYSAEGQGCSSASTLSVTQSDVFVTLSSSSGAHPLQLPMMVLLPTPVVSARLPEDLPLLLLHSSGSSDARLMRQSLLEGEPALCFFFFSFSR